MNIVIQEKTIYNQRILSYPDYIYHASIKQNIYWEKEIVDEMIAHIRPNSDVLDIGANIGLITIGLLKEAHNKDIPIRKVHCFECVPTTFFLLSENTIPYKEMVELYPFAVSDKYGLCNIGIIPYNHGCNYIYKTQDTSYTYQHMTTTSTIIQKNDRMHVMSIPLDTIEHQFNDISVVKIDVEGFELHVLRGMKHILQSHKPIVFVEIWDENPVIEFMIEIGYILEKKIEGKNYIFSPING
jgi:FkbM family methyltransferase